MSLCTEPIGSDHATYSDFENRLLGTPQVFLSMPKCLHDADKIILLQGFDLSLSLSA